jgi:hypothetical protein
MERKKRFKNSQEMLSFLRKMSKRSGTSSKRASAQFEKEKKAWEEREKAYDLDLEKKKHEDFLKRIRKIIREQKALAEKVERIMMRQAERSNILKVKKYKLASDGSAIVAEPSVKYKSKKK